MLVLSRKQHERILFPNLGVTLEVLKISGNAVRIGVTAPRDVEILREELAQRGICRNESDEAPGRHEWRNRLNTVGLALHLLQKQLDAKMFEAADATLARAIDGLRQLDAVAAGGAAARSQGGENGAARRTSTKPHALLVEDNANERELLAGFLRLNGYDVDIAEDGLAAINYLARRARPDVVLLDIQMPRMDGCETVSAIRCNPDFHGLKVFAVSGADRATIPVDGGRRGVDRWFSKPLDPSVLVNELNHELRASPR